MIAEEVTTHEDATGYLFTYCFPPGARFRSATAGEVYAATSVAQLWTKADEDGQFPVAYFLHPLREAKGLSPQWVSQEDLLNLSLWELISER